MCWYVARIVLLDELLALQIRVAGRHDREGDGESLLKCQTARLCVTVARDVSWLVAADSCLLARLDAGH